MTASLTKPAGPHTIALSSKLAPLSTTSQKCTPTHPSLHLRWQHPAKKVQRQDIVCHTPAVATVPFSRSMSKSSSSKRTRVAAAAGTFFHSLRSNCAKKNAAKRAGKKNRKLQSNVISVSLPPHLSNLMFTAQDVQRYTLVFDGGVSHTPPIQKPSNFDCNLPSWKSVSISNGEMMIVDTKNAAKGLTYQHSNKNTPPFIRLPRKAALTMTGMSDIHCSTRFYNALSSVEAKQRSGHIRGKKRQVFVQPGHKYCTIGTQQKRNSTGVRATTYHAMKIDPGEWDFIVDIMKRYDKVYCSYVNSAEIQRVNMARGILSYPTMQKINAKTSLDCCTHLGALACSVGVFLNAHTDDDSTFAIMSAHLPNCEYRFLDRIVAYFCFPCLGMAVALRPGDALIFNPQEPHSVSSQCHAEDEVFLVSMYSKTAVVGGNNNSLPLKPIEEIILNNPA